MKEKEVYDTEQTLLEELHIVKNMAYIIAHTNQNEEFEAFLHRIAKDSLNNAISLWKRLENKYFTNDIYDRDIDKNARKIQTLIKKHISFYQKLFEKSITKKDRELFDYIVKNKERHMAIINRLMEDE